jgi:RND family efflux transporter MFP subunit
MAERVGDTQVRNIARVRAAKARRRLLRNLVIVVVLVGAVAGFWLARRSRSQAANGLVKATAKRMDLVETVSASGSVTAQTGAMVKIGSQITGRIKHLYADVGDQMQAGQVIAELDVPDLDAQVGQAEATLALNRERLAEQRAGVSLQDTQTEAEIKKAQAGVALAQANLRQVQQSADQQRATAESGVRQAQANAKNSAAGLSRAQQLFEKGYIAAADVDNARAQAEVNAAQLASARDNVKLVNAKLDADLSSAREQLKQAQASLVAAQAAVADQAIKRKQVKEAQETVRQSEASLALARAQRDKAFIRTPISGTVLQLAQQEGETIAAGLSAPTVIIVANLDRLQVDAFVDETDIGHVSLGLPAQVTVDAYPNHPFFGRVEKIASGATMQQNVVTYDVTVSLANPSHLLKPDMTASVSIEVERKRGALAVPVDAIKPGLRGPTVTVMTRGRNGKSSFPVKRVRTGISDGDNTEILDGLKEGDAVVLAGKVPGMSTETEGPRIPGPLGFGAPRRGGRSGR